MKQIIDIQEAIHKLKNEINKAYRHFDEWIMRAASSDPFRPLIPIQSGHPFRRNPATYSDPFRPVIPIESGHP